MTGLQSVGIAGINIRVGPARTSLSRRDGIGAPGCQGSLRRRRRLRQSSRRHANAGPVLYGQNGQLLHHHHSNIRRLHGVCAGVSGHRQHSARVARGVRAPQDPPQGARLLLSDMRTLPDDPVVQTKTIRLDLWYLKQQEELR